MNAPNARFGAFEVLKRLAIGGMGEIFLARQTGIKGFERLAIIKTLLPDLQEDEERVEMFLAEARIAALLNHPNIVQVFDVGEQDGTYYIAMEYVDGDTTGALVRAALKAQKHSAWPFVTLMAQAARALNYAHTQVGPTGQPLHLVHRDISPQNIMIRRDGMTKVVDFGIAKVASDGARTKTGVIKGKLAYMAPEQLRADVLDGRADLYALGVVTWELTTGRRMFHNVPDVDIFKTILDGEVIRPSSMAEGFPPALEAVIMKSLALKPADRFQTGTEFADALEEAQRASNVVLSEPVPRWVEGLIGDAVRARSTTAVSTVARQVATPARGTSPGRPAASSHQLIPVPGALDPRPADDPPPIPISSSDISQLKTVQTGAMVPAPAAVTSAGPIPSPASLLSSPSMASMAAPLPAPPRRPAWMFAVAGALGALVLAGGGLAFMKEGSGPSPGANPAAPTTNPTPPLPLAKETAVPPTTPPPAQQVAARDPPPPQPDADPPAQNTGPRKPDRKPTPQTRRPDPPSERPAPPPPVAAPVAPAPAPAAQAPGLLTVATTPWATVTLDGKPVGTTPIFKLSVSPGPHELVLTNDAEGITKKLTLTVAPGETVVRKINLK